MGYDARKRPHSQIQVYCVTAAWLPWSFEHLIVVVFVHCTSGPSNECCAGRNYHALLTHEHGAIEDAKLSWQAVLEWAKLISEGQSANF